LAARGCAVAPDKRSTGGFFPVDVPRAGEEAPTTFWGGRWKMRTKQIVLAPMLAGILAVPVCAERLDGDGCGSLARLYDSEVATCTEQQHNEVQLKTGPCVDVQNRIVASGAEAPGSFLGMDEVPIASAPQIAQWVSLAASPRPFYAAFLQSSRSHSSTQTRIQNARIVSIPTFRRGGSGRTS
jgi:hypothetical protein